MRDDQRKKSAGQHAPYFHPHLTVMKRRLPPARHPLDDEAESALCMISDLRLHADLCRQALNDLLRRDEMRMHGVLQLRLDAIHYADGERCSHLSALPKNRRYAERWQDATRGSAQ